MKNIVSSVNVPRMNVLILILFSVFQWKYSKLSKCTKDERTDISDLIYYRIVIVENTQTQYFNVRNCSQQWQYDYASSALLHSQFFFVFFFLVKKNKMEKDNNLPIQTGHFRFNLYFLFIALYDAGTPLPSLENFDEVPDRFALNRSS